MGRLSAFEEQVFFALWHWPLGAVTGQVRQQLPGPLPYTTLASVLHQLVGKGYVQCSKRGRLNWFVPSLSKEAYGMGQLAQLVGTCFHGSYPQFLAACVRRELLLPAHVAETLSLVATRA
jgi:BlaI family penicillinase repressor